MKKGKGKERKEKQRKSLGEERESKARKEKTRGWTAAQTDGRKESGDERRMEGAEKEGTEGKKMSLKS